MGIALKEDRRLATFLAATFRSSLLSELFSLFVRTHASECTEASRA